MSKTVLVFDFGASSARAMLCKCENGGISLEEIHRFPNVPITENGHLRWDIDELWEQMKIAISFGVFNGGFDAISIDTWGVDFGLIGQDGELLEKPVHYRDSRTEGMLEEVCAKIPAKELFMQSGIQPMNINTLFQLNYLVNHEKNSIFRAEKLLMMPDLFAYFLTGQFKNEFTEATTTQLIDQKAKGWNIPLIEALGIPKRIFSPLIQPGEMYGELKQELADEFRIENVPVYACPSHDTASAVLAVPSQEEHFAFLSCGTWTLFGTELRRPVVTEQAMKMGLTNEGGSGGTTTLLKNIMGLWLIQETRRWYNEKDGRDYSFSELEKMALESAPFVSFIDPNAPDFAAPDDMPLKIQEFCRRTGQKVPETPGEIMRCIYQSLACEFALTLGEISELIGFEFKQIHMIGGGTKDKLLCQLTADAAGITAVAGPVEATALGNGLSTLIALGEIPDIAAARQMIIDSGLTQEFQPQQHEKWLQPLESYKKLTR
ncbi:MAG: rhamnulokinase [Oscillospiraceae bacterium]|nr:rhamnulokinase [Oscillospiraceae bacterium]